MNRKNVFNLGLLLFLLVVGGLGITAVFTPLVHADTITVDTTADEVNTNGNCSLREAILSANGDTAVDSCTAGSGADVITLPPGTYTLSLAGAGENAAQTGDLDITADVTINGGGMNNSIIDGAGADRIFEVHSGATATINDLTVRNGSNVSGGGISVAGTLTLNRSRVTGSTATSSGGGIFAGGTLTVTHSRVDGNTANGGGGVFVSFLSTTIMNSEISGNTATGGGGGISSSGTLNVVNSTLSGNIAGGNGGGLYTVESNNNHLYNVTISNNTADSDANDSGDGGGVFMLGGTSATNTLIGGNTDNSPGQKRPDCSGSLNSEGYNLITNVTGCTINGDTIGNLTGVDPMLGPLQNNGGATLTQALLAGSPAINAGNPGGCRDQNAALLGTDQRGFSRPANGSPLCDMGAYEAGAVDAPTPTPTATLVPTIAFTPDHWNYLPLIEK
ncbi:MAG: CSLREA domain-containing protein [Ardenticatenaceae bacterium]|nr:CSLREA domain-containing protein [Ardenticatenaceae bacterium]